MALDFLVNKRIFLYGMGISARSLAKFLTQKKLPVKVWDDRHETQDALKNESEAWVLEDLTKTHFTPEDIVVFAPSISLDFPEVNPIYARAKQAGALVCCDIDLYMRLYPAPTYIGVTGTNGKSTVVALTAHALENLDFDVHYGGNIGVPIFDVVPAEVMVLELSSYQLELINQSNFSAGLLLNITPDHLDHHGSMEKYCAAKAKLYDLVKPGGGLCLLAEPSQYTKKIQQQFPECLIVTDFPQYYQSAQLPLSLQGPHNMLNARSVEVLLTQLYGIRLNRFLLAIASFRGLNHRQQVIAQGGLITWVDDSKATNVASAVQALARFSQIYWLVGGVFKEENIPISEIKPYAEKIKGVYGYGRDQAPFQEMSAELGFQYHSVRTLEDAMRLAFQEARESAVEATILLSPCCASFDQFKNYSHRGQVFKEQVMLLIQEPGR